MTPVLTIYLLITHKIYKSFDYGVEDWCVFLDISKALNKVWSIKGSFSNCIEVVSLEFFKNFHVIFYIVANND